MLAISISKVLTTVADGGINAHDDELRGAAADDGSNAKQPGRKNTRSHGKSNNPSIGGKPTVEEHARPHLPMLNGGRVVRGCVEAAVSTLVTAMATCLMASGNFVIQQAMIGGQQQQHENSSTSANTVTGQVVAPPILQSSKRAGTEECRDSARALLRFFGHTSLLHLEGVIWIKMSGERGERRERHM